jgi:uncharacterized protein YbjT (DUF2867 family)
MTVVLTGATGGLGSQVLKALLTLVSPETIRISTRDPSKLAPDIQSSGVKTFKGDFSYPESLLEPFKDAEALLLVSYPSIAHEERVRMHVGAIDAAKKAGVKHVFYTSLAFEPSGGAAVFAAHRDTEAYLKKSGLTYTIIREGIYSESYPLYFGEAGFVFFAVSADLILRFLRAWKCSTGRVRPRRWRHCLGE